MTNDTTEPAWLTEAYQRKEDGRECFAHAVTTREVEATQWNGHFAPEESYVIPAGTRVLITMASRFGDVGIRGRNIDRIEHGYHARVEPESLRNVVFVDDGGRPWRKEMMERFAAEEAAEAKAAPKPKVPATKTRERARRVKQAQRKEIGR